jgi:hypothetical protein
LEELIIKYFPCARDILKKLNKKLTKMKKNFKKSGILGNQVKISALDTSLIVGLPRCARD